MSDQPKPTGEWAAAFEENSSSWYVCAGKNGEPVIEWPLDSRDLAFKICDAHNASIDAERCALEAWQSQFGTSQLSHAIAERDSLNQQLAAEREKAKHDLELLADAHDIVCNQLREQLAAEREKLEGVIDDEIDKNNTLHHQLAAEREKFQKAKEWNRITEIELNNLRSLLNEIDPDISRKTIAELRQQLAIVAEQLKRYMVAMGAIYNHNEAARSAVEIHFGTLHPPEAFDALVKVKERK